MEKNVLNTNLNGKVVVVTGAGGVLCSYFAKVVARAGAKVALLDLNEEAAKQFAEEIVAEGSSWLRFVRQGAWYYVYAWCMGYAGQIKGGKIRSE